MPPNRLNQSLMKPFVALAVPGMYLVYKYNQFKRQQQENSRRKVAEKELAHLNSKIDKLLAKLDDHDAEIQLSEGEECVVCLSAKATMQTYPCGHKVVCRKCFVKTIQVAVTQRCLPLRCVVCRSRILKLKQTAPGRSSSSGAGTVREGHVVPSSRSQSAGRGTQSLRQTSSSRTTTVTQSRQQQVAISRTAQQVAKDMWAHGYSIAKDSRHTTHASHSSHSTHAPHTPNASHSAHTNSPRTSRGTTHTNSPRPSRGTAHTNSPRTACGTTHTNSPRPSHGTTHTNSPRTTRGTAHTNSPRLSRVTHTNSPRTSRGQTNSNKTPQHVAVTATKARRTSKQ